MSCLSRHVALRIELLWGNDRVCEDSRGPRYARRHLRGCGARVLRSDEPLRLRLRTALKETFVFEPVIGLAVAALLAVYLVYTLIRPERF